MKYFKHSICGAIVVVLLALPLAHSFAATLMLVPSNVTVGLGQTFTVDVKVDSAGVGFNAAQATINFPKDLLDASIDKTDSAFGFWLEEPVVSNAQGSIEFIGGTPYGISGSSIRVLKLVFKAKSAGKGSISIGNAAITASDGTGSNILSTTTDAIVQVSPTKGATATAVVAPAQIVRQAVPSQALPSAPVVQVPLYPDATTWYNQGGAPLTVNWNLPPDVVGVSTAIDKHPDFDPSTSEGLFDSKMFSPLSDGTWYLHVRFKNNVGWGATTHWRIAIDTQPPLGFKIVMSNDAPSDDPAPALQFKTDDSLSGLKEYQIRVDNGALATISVKDFSGVYPVPPQAPGNHRVSVRAVDVAGNSVEDFVTFQVLPIASPTISFITNQLFLEDQKGLTVRGGALASTTVLLLLHQGSTTIASESVPVDPQGGWGFTFDQVLRNGTYQVSAQSQDARGAVSLVVESQSIYVQSRPIIQLGVLQLGASGTILLLLLILLLGFVLGLVFYRRRRDTLERRLTMAASDTSKVFKLISDDLEKIQSAGAEKGDTEVLKRLQEHVEKMEGYLQKEIINIKK